MHIYKAIKSSQEKIWYYRKNYLKNTIYLSQNKDNISGGLISTSPTQNINYESLSGTSTSFQLTVTVSDGYDTSTATLTVSIADQNEAPQFGKALYAISGSEGAVSKHTN